LFEDDFLAWRYGPVVDRIYKHLKGFGAQEVDTVIQEPSFAGKSSGPWSGTAAIDPDDAQTLDFLEEVWPTYSSIETLGLVNMTYSDNAPWRQIASGLSHWSYETKIVPKDLIKLHISSYLENAPPKDNAAL
jgi:uncharacterized phage-associated protein